MPTGVNDDGAAGRRAGGRLVDRKGWATNLFLPRRSGKSTLVIQRSRGPTVPRFLRSNLLDDFFFFGARAADSQPASHLALRRSGSRKTSLRTVAAAVDKPR